MLNGERVYNYKPDRKIMLSAVISIIVSIIFYVLLTIARSRHHIEDLATFIKLFYTFGLAMTLFIISLKVFYDNQKHLSIQRDKLIYSYGLFNPKIDVIPIRRIISVTETLSPTQEFFGSSTLTILIDDDEYLEVLKFKDIAFGDEAQYFILHLLK